MSRRLAARLSAGLTAALLCGWYWLDRNVQRLDAALGRQLERVERLEAMVEESSAGIAKGYRRIDEARMRHESALQQIADAQLGVSAAAEERAEAETLAQEAQTRAQAAREQAAEADRRERAERRRREEEWSRLERALGKVAKTRRQRWTLHAAFAPGLLADRERISRLAGILLAHHGYRAVVDGDDAAKVVAYFESAGIPADLVSVGRSAGPLQLTVRDQILGRGE